jgi:5-methylcytosine-specific restriction endonuclease McrA
MAAFESQGGLCPYTGRALTYGTAEIDHVAPRWLHGKDALVAENIVWVHPDVNRAKSGLTHEEFIALCRDIADHVGR